MFVTRIILNKLQNFLRWCICEAISSFSESIPQLLEKVLQSLFKGGIELLELLCNILSSFNRIAQPSSDFYLLNFLPILNM